MANPLPFICLTPEQSQGRRDIKGLGGHTYTFRGTNDQGLHCYQLIVGGKKKKKKAVSPPSCICTATLIAEPPLMPEGGTLTLTYTTSPCADSASIRTLPFTGTIPAPPPGGVIVLNPGDTGYPLTGGNTYTLTVVTNTGECTASADVFVIV